MTTRGGRPPSRSGAGRRGESDLRSDAGRLLELLRTLLGAAFRHLFWSSRVAEIELTFAQAQMLNYVARHPGCAMGDVARHFGVTLPNVTQLVDRLQHKGFVSRGSDPADRRVCTLTLTAEGRGLVAELERLRAGRLESVLARMTARDRERVLKGLEALVEAALRVGAESDDPGACQPPRYRSSPR